MGWKQPFHPISEKHKQFPVSREYRTIDEQRNLYNQFRSDLDNFGMPTKQETERLIRRKSMWFFIACALLIMGFGGFTFAALPVTFTQAEAQIAVALFGGAEILALAAAATMWRLSKK